MEGEHHEKAVELLKAAPASVKLVVRYTPKVKRILQFYFQSERYIFIISIKVLEEMEMRFDRQRQARRRQVYS